MTDFDYKKYSLDKLETWMRDALTAAEASPKEIYDVIRGVVHEEYHYFKHQTGRCYELLALLGGTNNLQEQVKAQGELWEKEDAILSCDKDDESPECKSAWDDFWNDVDEKHSREYNLREAEYYNQRAKLDAEFEKVKAAGGYEWTPVTPKDKVVKWQLPVEIDGTSGEYYIQFPDDLMEAANIEENDTVEWVDQGDGSYLLKKV